MTKSMRSLTIVESLSTTQSMTTNECGTFYIQTHDAYKWPNLVLLNELLFSLLFTNAKVEKTSLTLKSSKINAASVFSQPLLMT